MNPNKPDPAPETGNGNRQQSYDKAAGKTHEAAARVKDAAANRVEQAKQAAESAKHRASERVRVVGEAVRSLGEQLRAEDERMFANYAERASERIGDLASFLETAEPDTLIRQGEDLARRNPLAFFGGTFLVGLTIGRFLRSTAPDSRTSESTGLLAADTEPSTYESRDGIGVSPARPYGSVGGTEP